MLGSGRRRAPISRRLRLPWALASVLGVLALSLQSVGDAAAAAGPEPVKDPAALVNPFIGTSGAVNTFPGPDVPFGMMQWGPDTTPSRAQGGGYEYDSDRLSGFSLTHVSGPGCDVAGDVPILPVSGELPVDPSGSSVGFSHDDEQAETGSYTVTDSSGVTTELTDTARAGLGRFTFPAGARSSLLLKLGGGATPVDGTRVRVVGDREVTGSVDSGHFCGADNRYTLHFDIRFDRPFTESGTWTGKTVHRNADALRLGRTRPAPRSHPDGPSHQRHFTVPGAPSPTVHGARPPGGAAQPDAAGGHGAPVTDAGGMYLSFDTGTDRTVTAAVGISYTSDAGAVANRAAEIRGWDLDALRSASHDAWNEVLGRIRVGGGSHDQQVQFYTALYHALLHPNVFSDVDGRYMGMDDEVHRLTKGQKAQYANYSGWDTYRSQTQLMAMVEPDVTGDVVTSMLNGYDQTGLLPKWASNNGESYVMVGDPGTAIIADAHAFGARGFDAHHALEAMVHQATEPNDDRPGEAVRDAKGYLPLDGTDYGCCNFYGPVSTQLEYDSADYALASFAKSLGRKDLYEKFATRAQDWQNVFNPQSGYLQARNEDGGFAGGFTPGTSTGFVEGTSAQYTPMVPFNLKELITARGGTDAYDSYLDGLLDDITDPSGTDANLSNEPSVEIPWEYDYLGRPWKTQAAVREAQQKLYFNAPVGSFGNDDLGAMSSWYVWSMLGAYPETPGTDTLVLGSPAFPLAEITFADGHRLTVSAPRAAPGAPYVQSLTVGQQQWDRPWLTFGDFRTAGSLDFTLGTAPNTSWASSPDAVPPSDTTGGGKLLAATGPGGDGLIMAPGSDGGGTLSLTNLGGKAVTVDWAAQAPSGVTVEPSSGSVTVPATGRAQAEVSVTAGDTEGTYPVAFALTDHDGGRDLGTTSLRVAVAEPGELWPYETNKAEYPDGATFTGGFDDGGWAYSQDALAAAGVTSGAKVTADQITYTWPTMADGQPDNLTMAGQTIPEPAGTRGSALGLLGAAVNAGKDGVPGTLTVTYTDGSTAKERIAFGDWTLGGGSGSPIEGNTTAVTTAYRNTAGGGRDPVKAYVFATKVPLDPAKTVASVTLPVTGSSGSAHLFALTFAQ